jgi:hypothetical protein
MERLGFSLSKRRGHTTNRMEFSRVAPDGQLHWLELAPAAFDRAWIPLPHNDRSHLWLRHRVPSRKRSEIFVLAPAHALVLGATHASLHSFVRAPGLRLYLDVDRPVHDCSFNWSEVIEEAESLGTLRRCLIAMAISSALLGTQVPAHVLGRLWSEAVRWRAIRALLENERVVASGSAKLSRTRSLVLEALLDADLGSKWLVSILFPERTWMQEHFSYQSKRRMTSLELQLERLRRVAASGRAKQGDVR